MPGTAPRKICKIPRFDGEPRVEARVTVVCGMSRTDFLHLSLFLSRRGHTTGHMTLNEGEDD